jgi:GNAT superfamily N-acetyltransferase
MSIAIAKAVTAQDLRDVFEGDIPARHPDEYIQSRLQEDYVFLAQVNGVNAGFLIYSIWWGNCPFIELIEVRPGFRRQGIATALLRAAARELQDKGFRKLVSSSEIVNTLSLEFHAMLGFEWLNTLALPHGGEQFFSINLSDLSA